MFFRMTASMVWLCVVALACSINGCAQSAGDGQGAAGANDDPSAPGESTNGVPDTDGVSDTNGDSEPTIGDEPFADYTPDPEVYAAAPDEAMMLEGTTEDGDTTRFPANQMVALLVEDTPRTEAERLADEIGGTIVGQVPSIALYQFELPTTTLAELEEAVAQAEADPNVEAAGYNFDIHFADAPMCPAINDNEDNLILADRCPFEDTEYYQAITMFDIFRPHLRLHGVGVAVIDTGVQARNGEFSGIFPRLLNLGPGGSTGPMAWEDPSPTGHGTGVVGLIAADDNGSSINGIASRFLRDNLVLAVGPAQTAMDAFAMTEQAVDAHADIINLSLTTLRDPLMRYVEMSWTRLLRQHRDVLFVVAAGDGGRAITGSTPPAGLRFLCDDCAHVFTVGGTMSCWPEQRSLTTNYGPGVDMGAPGLAVPTVPKHGGGVRFADGTSFATAQVTSLAAILKSLAPELSPSQLVGYMLAETLPTTEELGGARLTFTFPIELLLLDIGVPDPVQSWIDPLDRHAQAATGILLSRICPTGITFHVEEYGTFNVSQQLYEEHMVTGLLNSAGLWIAGATEHEYFDIGTGQTPTDYSLRLGEYTVSPDPAVPDTVKVVFHLNDGQDAGCGLSGTVILESCAVVDRDPFEGVTPFFVSVSGSFEGVAEVLHLDGFDTTIHGFEGFFSNVPLGVGVGVVGPDDPIVDQIESLCEGGRGGDEPAEGEVDDEGE